MRLPRVPDAHLLFETVDEKYLKLISPFTFRQWHLLSCLYRIDGFASFLESSPGIGWMLASVWVFHKTKRPFDTIRRLILKKKRDIIEYLGFPRRDSAVKIIYKKIPKEIFFIDFFKYLRSAMQNEKIFKCLCYLPLVNVNVITCLCTKNVFDYCDMNFFEDLATYSAPPYDMTIDLNLYDTLRMLKNLWKKPKINSLAKLIKVHNEVSEILLKRKMEKMENIIFPPPPVPEIEGLIEPIQTEKELFEESLKMKHCVHSYDLRIFKKNSYCYRIFYPERATLELINNCNGIWNINQIRGYENKDVSDLTIQAIKNWLYNWYNFKILSMVVLQENYMSKFCLKFAMKWVIYALKMNIFY